MQIIGPGLDSAAQCEAVLRSLPMWFGIEESLLMYAADSARLPTFAAAEGDRIVGFLSLSRHFAHAWEVHCIAVHAEARNKGVGTTLLRHAERWLADQGVSILQVKTIADTSASKEYALTREFYAHAGFLPLEVFPLLWSERHPCLQLVKFISPRTEP